jgi:CheY-like chemotaxis protein
VTEVYCWRKTIEVRGDLTLLAATLNNQLKGRPLCVSLGPSHFPPMKTPLARPTALVIDDNPLFRRLTVDTLRKTGLQVMEAKDGFEGIRVLLRDARALRLLIVDTEMPGVHGWEVIRLAGSKAPKARILRLGRADDQAPGIEYQEFQAVPALDKPFTEAQLLESLANWA